MGSIIHVHSMYSVNDSTQTPEQIVKRVKEMGYRNVTLTDHGTLLGIIPFMNAGKEQGINTVPGCEIYRENRSHLIVFAKNYEGYKSISYAMRDANTHIMHGRAKKLSYPIVTRDILEKYFSNNENIVATTACIQSAVSLILLRNKMKEENTAKILAKEKDLVERNNEYVEAKAEMDAIANEIKEIKAKKSRYSKYVSPSYANNINKLEAKLWDMDAKSKEYADTSKKINDMKKNFASAAEYISIINKKIENKEIINKELKEKCKVLKKDRDKFLKLEDQLKGASLESEEQLYEEAKKELLYLKNIFPNLFVELQYHGLKMEEYVMPLLVRLAREMDIPLIAANDAHMTSNTEDCAEARRIVRFNYFQKSQTISDCDRELYIKSNEELYDALIKVVDKDAVEEAIRNTDVLDTCSVVFPDEKHYPSVNTNETLDSLIEKKRKELIKDGKWDDEHEKRLAYEIKVIKDMGFEDYHMVVQDICRIGRKLGHVPKNEVSRIPDDFKDIDEWLKVNNYDCGVGVGPGRGSAAGSLVCNMLDITNLDPLKYNLIFERFLNPERVTMPDIDMDIRTSLRPTMIKYLRSKYGETAICSIATEMKYGSKNAIQMAGRDRADQLYSEYPKQDKEKLKREYMNTLVYKMSDMVDDKLDKCEVAFDENFGGNSEAEIIWKRAKLIEGVMYGVGVHAGGIIISDNQNVNEYMPLAYNEEKEVWVAQCTKEKVEDRGLIKMDLLGVSNLDIISDTINMIKKYENKTIDIDAIDFEPEVFKEIYSKGNTNFVFQFESDGMKSMLKNFKPTCFEDIILLVACYRPGPMQYLDDIIAIKNGEKKISYKHPMLKDIISNTYCSIIYQEQVMQIFQKLAGYSLGGADLVRRAMSKKNVKKLEVERKAFVYGDDDRKIEGCIKRGVDEKTANELFDEMMRFAEYAFNKSHAAAYASLSYQTAWLKYHYPLYFCCALFNNKKQDEYAEIIEDCTTYNIRILPPDINASFYDFMVEDDCIRYGLKGIKGVGEAYYGYINRICENRSKAYYKTVQSVLVNNMILSDDKYKIPRKFYQLMIDCGAFDSFCNRLGIILPPEMSEATKERLEDVVNNELKLENVPENYTYNMSKEIELLGISVSRNPLDDYDNDEKYRCTPISEITDINSGTIFGFVESVEKKKSRKGNEMMIIGIRGKKGSCAAIAMGNVLNRYSDSDIIYKVMKFYINANDGTIFVRSMEYLKAKTEEYYAEIDTVDKTRIITEILNTENNERDYSIRLNCHYLGKNELYKAQRPLLVERKFTAREMKIMKDYGIIIEKWS